MSKAFTTVPIVPVSLCRVQIHRVCIIHFVATNSASLCVSSLITLPIATGVINGLVAGITTATYSIGGRLPNQNNYR